MSHNNEKKIIKIISSEIFLIPISLIMLIMLFVKGSAVNFFKEINAVISHIYVCILLIVIILTLISCVMNLLRIIKEMRNDIPFTSACAIFALVLLIAIPTLILYTEGKAFDTFLTISIGIVINQLFEGIFKYTEPLIDEKQEKKLKTLSGVVKIIFNCIYVSGYLTLLIKNMFFSQDNKTSTVYTGFIEFINNFNENKITKYYLIVVIIFTLLILFSLNLSGWLWKEIKQEVKPDLDVIKLQLNEKLKLIETIRSNSIHANEETVKILDDMEKSTKKDIEKLNNFKD